MEAERRAAAVYLAALGLSALLAAAVGLGPARADEQFRPVELTTRPLVMTGLGSKAAGPASGGPFRPFSLATRPLVMTGLGSKAQGQAPAGPFRPVRVTTKPLTMTGAPGGSALKLQERPLMQMAPRQK